jgi:hypothetical protein
MRAYLIGLNWAMSFIGLCVDMDRSAMWAVFAGFLWFVGSSLLLIHADRKGWMNELKNKLK